MDFLGLLSAVYEYFPVVELLYDSCTELLSLKSSHNGGSLDGDNDSRVSPEEPPGRERPEKPHSDSRSVTPQGPMERTEGEE